MVKTNIQSFPGEVEILSNLHVGSYLTANGAASNVLEITGNVGATFFIGDGGFLSNIATTLNDITNQGNVISNVVTFEANTNYGGVGLVTSSNVGIQNTNPIHTLDIGDKVVFDDSAVESSGQSVIRVDGRINATRFEGDGGLLSNIATTLSSIVNQGNTASNVVIFNAADEFDSGGVGLVTNSNVGIQNTSPTFNLSVGSNLHVDDTGANVLTVHGNVTASNLNLGVFSITPAYGLNDVCSTSNGTSNVVQFQNSNTSIVTTSNINVGGQVIITGATKGLDVTSNIELGGRLKFDSNVFIDTLRVADVATNLVTYDQSTGELLDSGGTFLNKFAVVSEQPPSDLFANATTVANHGTYTLTTSNLATDSNTFNAFDGTANAWVSGDGYIGGSNVFHETNLTQLSNLHPTQFGDWLAIEFPYKTTLRHMKLTPATVWQSFPYAANLYATNNDLTWTEIKYWDGLNPGSASNVQTITVNATEQFKKYALVTTKLVPNTNIASAVAIQDWQLFTESFSIDGGKVAMASSAVMGGETTVDQSGPHSRGEAKLKKYPEIVFESGKFDASRTSTGATFDEQYYLQAGTTVKVVNETTSRVAHQAFNGDIVNANGNGWSSLFGFDRNTGLYDTSNNRGDTFTDTNGDPHLGIWIQTKFPNKIKVKNINLYIGNNLYRFPKSLVVLGHSSLSSLTGWTLLHTETNISTTTPAVGDTTPTVLNVNADTAFDCYTILVKSARPESLAGQQSIWVSEIEYYGYEEDPPAGDTSVDTTFTSIMNTPQTTGANVYVDGNLGETLTNRVTGPTPTGTATTYNETGKYWELTGALTSNVTLEANTFLEGDQPHAVSVWFNSSNLEANVSNTCVFSVSDQEKLDSVNLDLQSNTWHNLTYAYQGEGGSRVTYLDGRKVAEDQAEDTFGEYPPFAMTGYSQGGYVVSASNQSGTNYESWRVFDDTTYAWETGSGRYNTSTPYTHTAGVTTVTNVTSRLGDYIQIDFPYKIQLDYFDFTAQNFSFHRSPHTGVLAGSNDGGVTWTEVKFFDVTVDGSPTSYSASGVTTFSGFNPGFYKSFRLIWLTLGTGSNNNRAACEELKLYGHRENDLVRLPDPTNVLKYPHIAMTGPAQRGYVVEASHQYATSGDGAAYNVFNTKENTWWGGYEAGNAARYTSPNFTYTGGGDSVSLGDTGISGEYIVLKLPYKITLSSLKLIVDDNINYAILHYTIVGSNNGTNWFTIKDVSGLTTSDYTASDPHTTTTDIVSSTAYSQIGLIVRQTSAAGQTAIEQIQYFGTQENSSIPIQIGGGNIDKVANFRVYDKFIDENQALEIWDAQKDTFRGVKNSATLHKGRLGIGTTEPEGRLAVADEPNIFEPRWPPKPLVDYNTYIEGYGEFVVHRSGDESTGQYRGNSWWIFDDNQNVFNYTYHGERDINDPINGNYSYFKGTNGEYTGGKSIGGISGDWTVLESPNPIKINDIIRMRVRSAGQATRGFIIAAANKFDGVWTKLTEQSNLVWQTGNVGESKTFHFENDTYYKYYAIIITQAPAQYGYPTLSDMVFSGIVQQGQSVLHDGQLTLTKNLNVPRIGPALDADDTPRRDRLVVEYNTSTNPTFEGAVRDTSGRGNDGVFYGGASYDATEKALVFDGTASDQYVHTLKNGTSESGNINYSVSLWFNPTTVNVARWRAVFAVGVLDRSQPTDNSNDEISLFVKNGGNALHLQNGDNSVETGALNAGQWVHVVVTYDGTNRKIYLDGSLSLSNGYTSLNLPKEMLIRLAQSIPAGGSESDEYMDCKISNFKTWFGASLTAEEVKTLYDMGRCDEGHHVVNFSKTRVGIGLGDGEAPRAALDVRGDIKIKNIQKNFAINTDGDIGNVDLFLKCSADTFTGGGGMTIQTGSGNKYWRMIASDYLSLGRFAFGYSTNNTSWSDSGYLVPSGNTQMNFTGQHRTFIKDVPFSQAGDIEGLIVSSDQNKYIKMSGGIEAGSNAITMNESLPIVSLSTTINDKKCFGVISASEDPETREEIHGNFGSIFEKEKGDTRVYINSVGEGAIWVSNIGGNLESGDYITTSNVAGYGQKQNDDVLHNYTVAKITMDCDFEPATQPVQQILRSNVVETYYLGNVHHTKTVPHEFVTTVVGADDAWSNVSVSPSDVTYAEWSNLEANTQNMYTLTYTQTSNVVYDTKYTLTTTANVTESDAWDRVFVDPPTVTYAEYSNLEANTQNTYTLTYTQTTTDEKTPDEWSTLESNVQSLYNKVYYQSVEEEVAKDYPGAVAHTRVTDRIENELDEHGQIQWEDHPTETEKAYKIRYLDASGVETDSANAVHIAAFVGCTYHCG
jgi:hypothetical protein